MPNYDLYDSINTTATRWIAYHYDKSKCDICYYNYKEIDKSFLWLLRITNDFCKIYDKIFYVSCSWTKYIYLKYIKHFNKIKYLRAPARIFSIDVKVFIHELTRSFEVDDDFVIAIYDNYYRR